MIWGLIAAGIPCWRESTRQPNIQLPQDFKNPAGVWVYYGWGFKPLFILLRTSDRDHRGSPGLPVVRVSILAQRFLDFQNYNVIAIGYFHKPVSTGRDPIPGKGEESGR
jgi:hypothetical protein